jgi:hypothetical protein
MRKYCSTVYVNAHLEFELIICHLIVIIVIEQHGILCLILFNFWLF